MSVIHTERLRLRPARENDLWAFHALLSDPETMAYWSTLPHADLSVTRAWLADMIALDPKEGEDFAIERNGEVIGKAGLYRFPEIGYVLRRDMWDRGYAAEALVPVIARAFGRHGLSTIEADVDPRNIASLRLLERLGFRECSRVQRTWLVGDAWCDSVYLRLRRDDWSPAT